MRAVEAACARRDDDAIDIPVDGVLRVDECESGRQLGSLLDDIEDRDVFRRSSPTGNSSSSSFTTANDHPDSYTSLVSVFSEEKWVSEGNENDSSCTADGKAGHDTVFNVQNCLFQPPSLKMICEVVLAKQVCVNI